MKKMILTFPEGADASGVIDIDLDVNPRSPHLVIIKDLDDCHRRSRGLPRDTPWCDFGCILYVRQYCHAVGFSLISLEDAKALLAEWHGERLNQD